MREDQILTQARDIMIDAFGRVYALYGLPEVTGRIYGLLYFSHRPMSLDEIAGELKVSKATVSVTVRFLEGLKSIRKVWIKGSRRDHYEAERDLASILEQQIKNGMQKEVEITSEAIKKSRELLKEITDSSINNDCLDIAGKYSEYLSNLENDYEWNYSFLLKLLEGRKKRELR